MDGLLWKTTKGGFLQGTSIIVRFHGPGFIVIKQGFYYILRKKRSISREHLDLLNILKLIDTGCQKI